MRGFDRGCGIEGHPGERNECIAGVPPPVFETARVLGGQAESLPRWKSAETRFVDKVTTRDYLKRMKAVGVKNLKARLSEHLRAVKAGETILVTERDEVIAELRPARGRLHAEPPFGAAVAGLTETGELTAPVLAKGGWSWKVRGLGLPPGAAASLLDDVRADRR